MITYPFIVPKLSAVLHNDNSVSWKEKSLMTYIFETLRRSELKIIGFAINYCVDNYDFMFYD